MGSEKQAWAGLRQLYTFVCSCSKGSYYATQLRPVVCSIKAEWSYLISGLGRQWGLVRSQLSASLGCKQMLVFCNLSLVASEHQQAHPPQAALLIYPPLSSPLSTPHLVSAVLRHHLGSLRLPGFRIQSLHWQPLACLCQQSVFS